MKSKKNNIDYSFKKFLFSLYKPVWGRTLIMLISISLCSVCSLFKQLLFKEVIDFDYETQKNKLFICLALLIGTVILDLVFFYIHNIIRCIKLYRVQVPYTAKKSYNIATKNGYPFFVDNHSGKVCSAINDITNGVDAINKIFADDFLLLIAKMITDLIVLFSINIWIFLVVAVLFTGITVIRIIYFRKRFVPLIKDAQTVQMEYCGMLNDAFLNIASLKVFNSVKEYSNNLIKKESESANLVAKAHKREFIFGTIANVIFVTVLCLLSWYAITLLDAKMLTIGALVIFFTSIMEIKNLSTRFSWGFINLSRVLITMKNAYNLIVPEQPEPVDDLPEIKVTQGKVDFKNLYFRYNKEFVFNGFNLSVKGGEKLGIIGVSGSGKTTLSNLMFKFYQPEKGSIKIDGQDINKYSTTSLYEVLSYVPQETLLLHTTIFDNIKLAKPDASKQEVEEAAKEAEIHDFIMNLEHGYDTIVGERGIKLSGGQRQRIAIARIFLRKSKIIICDEATSSLDNNTEYLVQQNITSCFKNQTLICIAHRLSTLSSMDRIIVIENGKIIDEGKPETIIPKYEIQIKSSEFD